MNDHNPEPDLSLPTFLLTAGIFVLLAVFLWLGSLLGGGP